MRLTTLAVALALAAMSAGISGAQQANIWSCNSQNGQKTVESVSVDAGQIQDGPGGVRSNTWCEWRIAVPPGQSSSPRRIKLTFRTMQMMSGEDFIWIYDDAVSTTVPVARVTGTNKPPTIVSATDKGLRVEFRSSEFGAPGSVAEEQGFHADFKAIDVRGVCNPNPCSEHSVCIEDDAGAYRCTRCPMGFTGDPNRPGGCQKVVPCPKPSLVRRDLRLLTAKERDDLFGAMQALRASGVWDEIMWIHADKLNFNFAHLTDAFLPWHRQYLRMMEDALHSVAPDTNCLAIPFWDWTVDAADPLTSFVFTDAYFGGSGTPRADGKKCVASGRFAWSVLGNDCLQRDLSSAGFIATREEILNTISSNNNFREFSRAIELWHDTVHRFIGGTMVLDNSADEPLFFVHHAFIDMLWSVWQDCHEYDLIPAASIRSNTNVFGGGVERGSLGASVNTDYNVPMPYRLSHANPIVAPRDVMEIGRQMKVSYDNEHILTKPLTIEWFDPRWTTCTIESTELFKKLPIRFTGQASEAIAAAGSGGAPNFGALDVDDDDEARGSPYAVMNGEQICSHAHVNFTDKCIVVRRWSAFELRYVARTLPSCQREQLISCLFERK